MGVGVVVGVLCGVVWWGRGVWLGEVGGGVRCVWGFGGEGVGG